MKKDAFTGFWGKRTTKGKAGLGEKSGTATRRSDMEKETIRKGQNPPTVPDELRKTPSSAGATRNTTTRVSRKDLIRKNRQKSCKNSVRYPVERIESTIMRDLVRANGKHQIRAKKWPY